MSTASKILVTRPIPDYVGDYHLAKMQANAIMSYWHSRGYKSVKVWLETQLTASGTKLYFIRSNMVFKF